MIFQIIILSNPGKLTIYNCLKDFFNSYAVFTIHIAPNLRLIDLQMSKNRL
jgi:hypothetical protein